MGMNARILGVVALVIAAALALSNCQTLNESQCQVSDWRLLGSTDGAAGRSQTHVARHQEACAKYGIAVDIAAWQTGWDEGIRRYCTPRNGLDVGMRGSSYANSCPGDVAVSFREAYDLGRAVWQARTERDRLEREIETAIEGLANVKGKDRSAAQIQIELKRSQLFSAQNRLNDAERAVDFYRLRQSSDR